MPRKSPIRVWFVRSVAATTVLNVLACSREEGTPEAAGTVDRSTSASDAAPGPGHWPQFRGPQASGIAEGYSTPTTWDVETSKNVKWKTPIPGLGHSCPVIWGNRLFVTTAISGRADADLLVGLYGNVTPVEDDTKHVWRIYCLDKNDGKVIWDRVACEGVPKIKRHTKATHANSTPATDGKHVVSFFGSEGLFCYTVEGELLWKKDLGELDAGWYVQPAAQWGFGSSPVIHDGKVYIQCDVQENSFLAAYEVTTGKEIWRTPRDDVPTWSTPTILETGGRSQVIANGYKHIGGYDLATGKELWKLVGGGDIPVPTPIVAHDLIYITSAHGRLAPLYAIRTAASGDITLADGETRSEHIAWSYSRRGTYMQTVLVYDGRLYACRDNGTLTCFDALTGKLQFQRRLGRGSTGFTASAVAADGKIYFTGEEGDIFVLQAGPTYKLLATNAMGEVCMATPAISQGRLYFRTEHHVVSVGG